MQVADLNTGPPNVEETMFQKHWTTDLEEPINIGSRNSARVTLRQQMKKKERNEERDEQSTIKFWTCQTKMIRY